MVMRRGAFTLMDVRRVALSKRVGEGPPCEAYPFSSATMGVAGTLATPAEEIAGTGCSPVPQPTRCNIATRCGCENESVAREH